MSCSNMQIRRMDIEVKDTKCDLVMSPESAMFCAHLSNFGSFEDYQ